MVLVVFILANSLPVWCWPSPRFPAGRRARGGPPGWDVSWPAWAVRWRACSEWRWAPAAAAPADPACCSWCSPCFPSCHPPEPRGCKGSPVWAYSRRRIKTEEKVKVVTAVWGENFFFFQFILPRAILKKRMNFSFLSNLPGAIHPIIQNRLGQNN